MADLTRLRTILMDHGSCAIPLGAVAHHMLRGARSRVAYDPDYIRAVTEWMGAAPAPAYGDVIGSFGLSPGDITNLLTDADDTDLGRAATLANAMAVHDQEYDRATRDSYSTATSIHVADARRLGAQSSAEFAALDALTSVGYLGIDDAVSCLAHLRRVIKNTFVLHNRQFARSRHAITAKFTRADGRTRIIVTPWCLSRRNAQAYAALCLADWHRSAVQERIVERARTVASFAERASLQAVRDIIAPALAMLLRYSYDPGRMAFVNDAGNVEQSVGARAPSVTVAFAAVFSSGACDAVMQLAEARSALAKTLLDPSPAATALDYLNLADSPWSALALFSRSLAEHRTQREATPWGDRVNKGAMLGYVARERDRAARNTAACVNRLSEVATLLRLRGHDPCNTLIVVEWGGHVLPHAVLGAAATAKLNVALDVADSGVDVPGQDVFGPDDDAPHHYQLYLASAQARMLPRMPAVAYRAGTPLVDKLQAVAQAVSGGSPPFAIAYLSGGMTQLAETPVSVCADAYSRMLAMEHARQSSNIAFYCTEFLLPPACPHVVALDPERYLDEACVGDEECLQCEAHYRAITSASDIIDRDGVRVVKARSMFGHNAHFGVEWGGAKDTPETDSMVTIDSALACNVMRNHEYQNPPPPAVEGKDVTSPDLMEMTKPLIATVYSLLAGNYRGPLTEDDTQSIAASVR
ncbi:P2 [Setosphaeria turcica polymycovirus 1]|nr:P2 [Setosphaeria turcica polymycovirus 1]